MTIKENNADSFNIFLENIDKDCEEIENEIFEKLKKTAPKIVKAELRKIRRKGKVSAERIKHMCNDVKAITTKDTFGYKILKIKGGKKTGPLWHIVNDGTYRSKATHFMDKSMGAIDDVSESVIDAVMSKESKRQ